MGRKEARLSVSQALVVFSKLLRIEFRQQVVNKGNAGQRSISHIDINSNR